jgi:peptide deformylase
VAVLPILEIPNPVLRKRAKRVRTIDSSTLRLAYDMVDTMREARGVGLAANQVGVLKRLIVVQLPDEEEARIYINPEIVRREGEREVEEGCLSIPGYKGLITRSVWIRFRAVDHASQTVKLRADELLAQVLEHEVDHLNGILYSDHLKEHQQLIPVPPEPESEDGTSDECNQVGEAPSTAADRDEAAASLTVS